MALYLGRGARGEAVTILQDALCRAGYDVDVDGIFGPATQSALMAFQGDSGLDADGIAGPHTWAALGVEFDEEPEVRLLSQGARGDDVEELQNELVRIGYNIDVDGVFGPMTYDAVCDFQESVGLVVDGIVGPRTWAALDAQGS